MEYFNQFRLSCLDCRNLILQLPLILFLLLLCPWRSDVHAFSLDFNTFKLGDNERAVLIIGGIQGDEPGGFSAATLLATRYEIKKGALWVVPNLNFPSIIKRSRGLHGDMNRKFLHLDESDPEFGTVRRIQELIEHPNVGLVLNLHDGSGYYRPVHEDKLKNPKRWGQSIIIDQETLENRIFFNELAENARKVASTANKALLRQEHAIHVHNTYTANGDREMEKSLSYFAVRKGKAAFGLEATKELPVAGRTYYHLLMVEEFLKLAGIEFSRDFDLSIKGIETALGENLGVSFADNRVFLPLDDVRKSINSLPLSQQSISDAITSKPIMAVLPCGKGESGICIHYGNRLLARIQPEWRAIDNDISSIPVLVDGEERTATFGQIMDVRKEITIKKLDGYRVNAIGWESGKKDESDCPLRKSSFKTNYSIDRQGSIFRIEVYKGKKFSGMFLVKFNKSGPKVANRPNLTDRGGVESSLGF